VSLVFVAVSNKSGTKFCKPAAKLAHNKTADVDRMAPDLMRDGVGMAVSGGGNLGERKLLADVTKILLGSPTEKIVGKLEIPVWLLAQRDREIPFSYVHAIGVEMPPAAMGAVFHRGENRPQLHA
jgi:hypothetical protein